MRVIAPDAGHCFRGIFALLNLFWASDLICKVICSWTLLQARCFRVFSDSFRFPVASLWSVSLRISLLYIYYNRPSNATLNIVSRWSISDQFPILQLLPLPQHITFF